MNPSVTVTITITGVAYLRQDATFVGSAAASFDGIASPFSNTTEMVGWNDLTQEQIDSGYYPQIVQLNPIVHEVQACGRVDIQLAGSGVYSGQVIIEVASGDLNVLVGSDWDPILDGDTSLPFPNGSASVSIFIGNPSDLCAGDEGGGGGGGGGGPVDPPPGDPEPTTAMEREHITRLFSWSRPTGSPILVAGTRSRLYIQTGDGNYQLVGSIHDLCRSHITDYMAVAPGRFLLDAIGNVLFIAHTEGGFWTWIPGSGFKRDTSTGARSSWEPIDDLIAFDITSARAVCECGGFILLGDVTEENERKQDMIVWSDFNDPRAFSPAGESLARRTRLGGERILSIKKLGTGVRVLTDQSIWAGQFVGGTEIWHFEKIYSGPDALEFPETVVKVGDRIYYMNSTGIMSIGESERSPQRTNLVDSAAGIIHGGLAKRWLSGLPYGVVQPRCSINEPDKMTPVGGWIQEYGILVFYWSTGYEGWPDTGIAFSLQDGSSCVLDHGATAITTHRDSGWTTYRRFLAETGFCDPAAEINEGEPRPIEFTEDITLAYMVHPDEGSGMFPDLDLTDFNAERDAPIGLIAKLEREGLCCVSCDDGTTITTLMASPLDQCIKQYDIDYFSREVVEDLSSPTWPEEEAEDGATVSSFSPHPTNEIQAGDITNIAFSLLWQTDAVSLGTPMEKTVHGMFVGYESQVTVQPCGNGLASDPSDIGVSLEGDWLLGAMVGASGGTSRMQWDTDEDQPLEHRVMVSSSPMKQYDGGETSPTFRFCAKGRYLVFRIFADGYEASRPHIGPLALSSVTVAISPSSCRW